MLHFKCRRRSIQRGFTAAEILSAIAVFALLSSFVVMIIAPMANAPNKVQAKIDTLQSATQGMYRLQRDLRMADPNGVWMCTSISTPACSQPSAGPAPAAAIVIVSPLQTGTNALQFDGTPLSLTVGLPIWSGVNVYWLTPNNSGSNTLMQQYVSQSTLGITIGAGSIGIGKLTLPIINLAVTNAVSSSNPSVVATNISQLLVNENTPTIGVQIVAQSTIGNRTNETTYRTNTFARN